MLKYMAYIWNPFKKRWKPRKKNGKPILDIWQRKRERYITETILSQRRREGKAPNSHFKIGVKARLNIHGNSK